MEARLSSMRNAAIAAFANGDDTCIVVGNIAEGEIPSVASFVREEAERFFGAVKESGSAKGSVAGRWDTHVVVTAPPQRIMAFIRERLGGSPNQMRPH